MVMYWHRCISGVYEPVAKCELLGSDVSASFCVICLLRDRECKDPVWFSDVVEKDSLKRVFDRVHSELSGARRHANNLS